MLRVSSPVFVSLLFVFQAVVVKSVWIPPRTPLIENKDYSHQEYVAKIHSDFDNGKGNIQYFLEGPGADQVPFNVFVVNHETGLIQLTQKLDRELIHTYNLKGVAKYLNGVEAEEKVDIKFKVVDENDNSPKFGIIKAGEVYELSPPGTPIMKINATDADEPGNVNSKIFYSIVSQSPSYGMFDITRDGILRVKNANLDRELADSYTVTVMAQDLDGAPGGNSATSTVTINVKDVNDNVPKLTQEKYEASIEENAEGVEVMRLKTEDLDLEGTENWESVFEIVKGNEAGYFKITTDPKTNEGVLWLDKAVDYEDVKDLDLGIAVRNKAPPFSGSGASGGWSSGSSWQSGTSFKTYPVKINVKNKPEGAAFSPKVKAIPISEGGQSININDVIASYPAIDGDTLKPAENVKYVKGSDPGNWLTIDPKTAEIKLNKLPDRESPLLVNGTYFAQVLCISEDDPSKTATGTVAIQVQDFNDHCPTLTSNFQTMCTSADHIIVNAIDEDGYPNGAPFEFSIIPEGTEGKWQVERLNDTAAILRAQEQFWPGFYKVEFNVKDAQGEACPEPQKVEIQVCTCEDGLVCGKRGSQGQLSKESVLGPAGIGLLCLGLLMLLLIPLLLLFCHCGSAAGMPGAFTEMPFDTKSNLINYHTEGQGENTEVPLITMPTVDGGEMMKMSNQSFVNAPMASMGFQQSVASMDGMNGGGYDDGYLRDRSWGTMTEHRGSAHYSEFQGRGSAAGGGRFDGMALPEHILAQYYTQKLASGNNNGAEDNLLVSNFEGNGSPAGSVGCCSDLESDNDLQFLDDLGPKFKTLAEECGGKKIQTEVKKVRAPAHTSVSRVMTQQLPPPPQVQPTIPQAERTVVRETVKESTVREGMTRVNEGMTRVNEGMANQGQMYMLQQQQPVYYTTTPMIQPMHYVVQPQVQNTVLLAEAPSTNLQGMVLVNGTQTLPSQGMMVQGQSMISTAQAQGPGMMLVGGSGVHTGIPSGAQTMMVVEGRVPAGSMKVLKGSQPSLVQAGGLSGYVPATSVKVLKGSQTSLVQGGTPLQGGLSGSQRVMVVGGPTSSQGQLIQEAGGLSQMKGSSGSQGVLFSKSGSSGGSKSSVVSSSTTTVMGTPTYSKTVVKEKFTEL
nr:desmoglein-3-like [Labrus bergylta]